MSESCSNTPESKQGLGKYRANIRGVVPIDSHADILCTPVQ